MKNGEVVGTQCPTGHSVLIDARFELPYDLPESEAAELQNKLEVLNNIMDQEMMTIKEQHRRPTYSQSGMSEDSDYTSDINYPTNHQHNSSAHQFRSEHPYARNITREESGDSRDFNYDPMDREYDREHGYYDNQESPYHQPRSDTDSEPLYYNSRPPQNYANDSPSDYSTAPPPQKQPQEFSPVYNQPDNRHGTHYHDDYRYNDYYGEDDPDIYDRHSDDYPPTDRLSSSQSQQTSQDYYTPANYFSA
ncbi:unnamed protein product, partial [Owenia fusiformis]